MWVINGVIESAWILLILLDSGGCVNDMQSGWNTFSFSSAETIGLGPNFSAENLSAEYSTLQFSGIAARMRARNPAAPSTAAE